jgi:hypothetical protein
MTSDGHSPRPSGTHRVADRRTRSQRSLSRARLCGVTIVVAALVSVGVMAIMRDAPAPATAATAAADCASQPTLTAFTATRTLLGVNATSPSQLRSDTAKFGHMPVLRVYYTGMPDPNLWTTGVQGINRSSVVVSFRSPPATVLSGAEDAALAKFFDSAPRGFPIYWSYYHEPEIPVRHGAFTVAQYKAAWVHIAAIAAAAHNPYLKATLILMAWDLDPSSGVNWKAYLPPGHVISVMGWDAYPEGTVEDSNPQPTPPAEFMGPAEAASRSVGLPFGFAEFALGTRNDRPQWLATVARYLRSTGALFGTLFDSTGFPWMELTDSASIRAWRQAVADSGSASPASRRSLPTPSRSPAVLSSSPPSRATHNPDIRRPAGPGELATSTGFGLPAADAAPTITGARVDPQTFSPDGANHVRILFRLSQPANAVICVLGRNGTILDDVSRPEQQAGWSLTWYPGREFDGSLLSRGHYAVVIVATNSAGRASAQAELTVRSL